MKSIAVFQELLKVAFYFALLGCTLGGCTAPKQPYYFSRYSNQDSRAQKTDDDVNSFDSLNSWSSSLDSATINATQNEDSLAGTIKNPVAPSHNKLNSPFFDKVELTENQISHHQEKIKMFNTWKAQMNEKSSLPNTSETLSITTEDRRKSNAWFLSTFGFIILFIPYLNIAIWVSFLAVIIALTALHIKELKIKAGMQEMESDGLLKIKKKKDRLTMPAVILGRVILSCLLLLGAREGFVKFFKWGLDLETKKYRPFKFP